MTANSIREGMTLRLKPDNPYGFEGDALLVTVECLKYRDGYRTPWIIDPAGRAFRPSDFQRAI